jgi:hypothetical protein
VLLAPQHTITSLQRSSHCGRPDDAQRIKAGIFSSFESITGEMKDPGQLRSNQLHSGLSGIGDRKDEQSLDPNRSLGDFDRHAASVPTPLDQLCAE